MKRYRLLKDLPDGGKIGDPYELAEFGYYNTRIYKEATAIDEGHRWETWQVEGNPDWWALIPEEKEETKEFQWTDELIIDFVKWKWATTKNGGDVISELTNIENIKWFKLMKQMIDRRNQDHIGIDRNGYETGKEKFEQGTTPDGKMWTSVTGIQKQDWEIVAIREKHDQFDQLHHIDKYDKKNWDYLLAFLKTNSTIYSVKRLSDNEVFSVGDEVCGGIYRGILKYFIAGGNTMLAYFSQVTTDNKCCDLKELRKYIPEHEQPYMKEVNTCTIEDLRKAFEESRTIYGLPSISTRYFHKDFESYLKSINQ